MSYSYKPSRRAYTNRRLSLLTSLYLVPVIVFRGYFVIKPIIYIMPDIVKRLTKKYFLKNQKKLLTNRDVRCIIKYALEKSDTSNANLKMLLKALRTLKIEQ